VRDKCRTRMNLGHRGSYGLHRDSGRSPGGSRAARAGHHRQHTSFGYLP
jgi:hypothetical protein